MTSCDGYQIRYSSRAKHVSIRVSNLGDVEVVVPQGFDSRKLPEILEKRKDWIAKTIQRVKAERQRFATETSSGTLPEQIVLRSLSEEWTVNYQRMSGTTLTAKMVPVNRLTISGPINHQDACQQLLRQWLKRQAESHLVPWLRRISTEIALPCNRIVVRGQRTLWASCSNQHNISLNYKLLFLPPQLVEYVFVHELCHTVHLNHSPKFWNLVAAHLPDCRRLDREASKAWRYVPEWVDRSA
jgi:predicted metal-dependent hydrolase